MSLAVRMALFPTIAPLDASAATVTTRQKPWACDHPTTGSASPSLLVVLKAINASFD